MHAVSASGHPPRFHVSVLVSQLTGLNELTQCVPLWQLEVKCMPATEGAVADAIITPL